MPRFEEAVMRGCDVDTRLCAVCRRSVISREVVKLGVEQRSSRIAVQLYGRSSCVLAMSVTNIAVQVYGDIYAATPR